MGSSDVEAPAKAAKTSAAVQEQPAATTSSATPAAYPEWSGFQAYSPMPPHGFFPSPVASSPQAHPYMWGQHIMPPYGTPPPPYVMYPPGGLYAHPSIPPGSHPFTPYAMPSPNGNIEASGAVPSGNEADGKSPEGKDKSPLKRSRGSLGSLNMITGKNHNEQTKTSSVPANGVPSQSGESGSEGSSEGSDANSNDSQGKTCGRQEGFEAEASVNGKTARDSQNGVSRVLSQLALTQAMAIMPMPSAGSSGGVTGPTTNLNIGMDYWGAPAPSTIPPIRGKVPASTVPGAIVPSEMWLQDERELKRQRRKQSNRESARRSRLRKQAECEELAQRVDTLKEENSSLRAEVGRIRKEYEQLLAQNASLKEKLGELPAGVDGSRPENNGKHSGSESGHQNLDSDAQAGQTDPGQNGH